MVRTNWTWQSGVLLAGLALAAAVAPAAGKAEARAAQPSWRTSFSVDKADLVDHGRNPYFILEPGYRLTLEGGPVRLVLSVLDETRVVDGVKTRVVEERETKGGQLVEVSRNFFAISKKTGDVYYFGEDVEMYKNGRVTGHEGAWLSGINGARFGLIVPGKPRVGDRYQQEMAPRVAMDRAEVVTVTETLQTPAGTFKNCMRTRETSGLESGSEDKLWAPRVGLIKDGELVLVRIEKPRP
jgi:hypothetical protein